MEKSDYKIVIPARFSSSRFPGKPLADIGGKPMIWHVHQRALATAANEVVIATDDNSVRSAALDFGAEVCMTSVECGSGTDRIAEVSEKRSWNSETIVVNLQGDEPLTPPSVIEQVATNLSNNKSASIATLCSKLTTLKDLHNPNIVKVVFNLSGYAMYFSRAPIPMARDSTESSLENAFRHIGIYAYRTHFLKEWKSLPLSKLESLEKLEQLRAMDSGVLIHVDTAKEVPPHGVDTPEQLTEIIELMRSKKIIGQFNTTDN